MHIHDFMPEVINWDELPKVTSNGETGSSSSRVKTIGDITIRRVDFSENYLADHWCAKGHIVFVIEGEIILYHKTQSTLHLKKGMSYLVGDNSSEHQLQSVIGASLLIID